MLIDRGGYKDPPPWPRPPIRKQAQRPHLKGLDEMLGRRRSLRRAAVAASRYLAIAALFGGVAYCVRYPSVLNRILNQPIFHRKLIWSRPAAAPNGSPWPARSNYVAGYPRLNVSGIAKVTADNSGGPSDLLVKLVDLDNRQRVVRVFFVKANDEFTLRDVKPGHYDVRYLNLDNGRIRESQLFEVTLRKTPKGEEYMGWTVGLYDVINGTSHHKDITERDF